MDDCFTKVGQGMPQRADRVRELGDRTPGDVRFEGSTTSFGARGEGRRGGEVGDQFGDAARTVGQVIEDVDAGVHRVGERYLVGRVVDALGQ
ncbi:hypothetical protein [Streptomyces sp. CB02460]|uniref:hypothetical protein n=1 Tax=Streptomyces sp. CB02460 TaxID=1703941 RepID=UPI000962155D|nr:hypothetical protein [Streptomyces sp. CB02460]OKJ72242.1 hypothetical protein AMK30_20965 [Streptomyces sp. CB02460]